MNLDGQQTVILEQTVAVLASLADIGRVVDVAVRHGDAYLHASVADHFVSGFAGLAASIIPGLLAPGCVVDTPSILE